MCVVESRWKPEVGHEPPTFYSGGVFRGCGGGATAVAAATAASAFQLGIYLRKNEAAQFRVCCALVRMCPLALPDFVRSRRVCARLS